MPRNKAILPLSIISRSDIIRLQKAIQSYEDQIHQAKLRGEKVPALTHDPALYELAEANGWQLSLASDRERILDQLDGYQKHPVEVTVSFADRPSEKALGILTRWLRTHINPAILIRVTIQPSIVGGCIIRTTNKVFVFDFRHMLNQADPVLKKEIASL